MQYITIEELRQMALRAMDGRTQQYVAGEMGVTKQTLNHALRQAPGGSNGLLARIVEHYGAGQISGPVKMWGFVDD